MPTKPYTVPTTGHPAGDALLPAALALVDAVHTEDRAAALDAIAAAQHASDGDPHWVFTLVCCLAALVPQDARLSELLAWVQPPPPAARSPRRAAPITTPGRAA